LLEDIAAGILRWSGFGGQVKMERPAQEEDRHGFCVGSPRPGLLEDMAAVILRWSGFGGLVEVFDAAQKKRGEHGSSSKIISFPQGEKWT
jgi:hypothetical protein